MQPAILSSARRRRAFKLAGGVYRRHFFAKKKVGGGPECREILQLCCRAYEGAQLERLLRARWQICLDSSLIIFGDKNYEYIVASGQGNSDVRRRYTKV